MVYDLMMRHNFRIVRSLRLKVDHNLMALPGTRMEDIQEVYSHEQAIGPVRPVPPDPPRGQDRPL